MEKLYRLVVSISKDGSCITDMYDFDISRESEKYIILKNRTAAVLLANLGIIQPDFTVNSHAIMSKGVFFRNKDDYHKYKKEIIEMMIIDSKTRLKDIEHAISILNTEYLFLKK